MEIVKPIVLDILDTKNPALSATSDMPLVETKPDASNEGKPPSQETPEQAAPSEEDKTTSESATELTEKTPGEPDAAKPARGVQKRLDELAKQREEQRARAEAAERRLDMLLTQQVKPKPAEPIEDNQEVEPQKPSRSAFNDPDVYESALVDYADKKASWAARREVRQAIAEQTRKIQESARFDEQLRIQQAYGARVEKLITKYPDYHEIAESPDVQISIPLASAILRSDSGPDVAYYLGSHPDEAKRINALHAELQLVEFGIIVAKLAAPPKPPTTPAPRPIKPIAASATSSSGESDEEPDMDTYAQRRRKAILDEQQQHVVRTRH